MPINRTPFNALVDDDGSGLTGSVWNKGAIQSVLLDPIDAMIVGGVKPTPVTVTATGTQNALNPPISDDTVILWTGTADLTLNGLVGGAVGRRVTILNRSGSAATIYVNHNNGSAGAGNRFSNSATSGPTPITAAGGAATWIYDPAFGGYWVIAAHEQGAAITPPYNAADYSTNVGTWTVAAGNVSLGRYVLKGRRLTFDFFFQGTTTAGSPAQLRRTFPNGYIAASPNWLGPVATVFEGSGGTTALGQAASTYFALLKGFDQAPWANYTAVHVGGIVTVEIT